MYKYCEIFGENGAWALLKNGGVVGRVYDEELAKRIIQLLNRVKP